MIQFPPGGWMALDERWSELAAARGRHPAAERWLAAVAHSGDSPWWLLGGGLLWWRGQGERRAWGRRIVLTTLAAGAASGLAKALVRRRRPAGRARILYLEFDRHSFPSGHATRAGALAVTLGAGMSRWGRAALVLWGALVGTSRVLLGIHFIGDIVGGFVLGALIGRLLGRERR